MGEPTVIYEPTPNEPFEQIEMIEWHLESATDYIGRLVFGRKHCYSGKKFWFHPEEKPESNEVYDLLEVVKFVKPIHQHIQDLYFWTDKEVCSILYSGSDSRSEYRTY